MFYQKKKGRAYVKGLILGIITENHNVGKETLHLSVVSNIYKTFNTLTKQNHLKAQSSFTKRCLIF
jgi:hypothetical protein